MSQNLLMRATVMIESHLTRDNASTDSSSILYGPSMDPIIKSSGRDRPNVLFPDRAFWKDSTIAGSPNSTISVGCCLETATFIASVC